MDVDRNVNTPTLLVISFFEVKVTNMSEMPCRLIDGLHEWRNEALIVPNYNSPNSPFWCEGQRFPVGREDPMKLYCRLLLQCELCCIVYVGVAKAEFSDFV